MTHRTVSPQDFLHAAAPSRPAAGGATPIAATATGERGGGATPAAGGATPAAPAPPSRPTPMTAGTAAANGAPPPMRDTAAATAPVGKAGTTPMRDTAAATAPAGKAGTTPGWQPEMLTFEQALVVVAAAREPLELFGKEPAAAGQRYRALAKLLHPDTAPAGRLGAARDAFARLALLWEQLRRGEHKLYEGDIAHLYGADGGQALRKMPRRGRDNDLMRAEADALSTLESDGDPRHRAYAPLLLRSYQHRDPATGVQRVVNVLQHLTGFVSLAQVAAAYPDGVDPRDAAWMWRRLLVALGYAHRAGIVHGAVLPEHVLIEPDQHGLALVDWCYSVRVGHSVAAMVAARKDFYPPEVAARRAASPGTDIYAATATMSWLMGARAPEALRRFAAGCAMANPKARPKDAWRLLAELDDVLHQLYGRRTFRPFTL